MPGGKPFVQLTNYNVDHNNTISVILRFGSIACVIRTDYRNMSFVHGSDLTIAM